MTDPISSLSPALLQQMLASANSSGLVGAVPKPGDGQMTVEQIATLVQIGEQAGMAPAEIEARLSQLPGSKDSMGTAKTALTQLSGDNSQAAAMIQTLLAAKNSSLNPMSDPHLGRDALAVGLSGGVTTLSLANRIAKSAMPGFTLTAAAKARATERLGLSGLDTTKFTEALQQSGQDLNVTRTAAVDVGRAVAPGTGNLATRISENALDKTAKFLPKAGRWLGESATSGWNWVRGVSSATTAAAKATLPTAGAAVSAVGLDAFHLGTVACNPIHVLYNMGGTTTSFNNVKAVGSMAFEDLGKNPALTAALADLGKQHTQLLEGFRSSYGGATTWGKQAFGTFTSKTTALKDQVAQEASVLKEAAAPATTKLTEAGGKLMEGAGTAMHEGGELLSQVKAGAGWGKIFRSGGEMTGALAADGARFGIVAGSKVLAKTVGKAVPALSVGIAGYTCYQFEQAMTDPNASTARKSILGVCALADSFCAVASFIPLVGTLTSAAVGTGSSLLNAFAPAV